MYSTSLFASWFHAVEKTVFGHLRCKFYAYNRVLKSTEKL
jgi:hypothetical protein